MTERRFTIMCAALALAVAVPVGACSGGGSGDDEASVSSGHDLTAEQEAEFETEVELAQCMRDHGLNGLPDPQISGNGFMLVAYPLARDEVTWTTAREACQPVLDGAAPPDGTAVTVGETSADTARQLTAEEAAEFETELEFAQCVREYGIEGLPDPQVSGNGFILVGVPLTRDAEEWSEAQEACVTVVDPAAQPDEIAAAAVWEQVVPGRDCQCSDGSEFSFWVHHADPDKIVFYLQDGGACWSAETCAPEGGLYTTTAEGPVGEAGIFDFADARNPFADYSVVYVPYCTADVHIGNATNEYTADLTVHHNGYVNGTAALDRLAETFPDATDVVVIGESAGSVAAPLYGGLASDRLPDAAITVLADGSGSYPDLPALNRRLAEAWGTGGTIADWPTSTGLTDEQWSIPGLFIQSGRHDPDIVFARHDYAYDETQQEYLELVDVAAADLLALIDANETQIESGGVNLLSYIAPGDSHTVLSDGLFYTEEVNGQRLVDWLTRLVEHESVDDVHCATCTAS